MLMWFWLYIKIVEISYRFSWIQDKVSQRKVSKVNIRSIKKKCTVTDMDFPHPWVYLRLCWVVDILGSCRCASRGLLLFQGWSFWRAVPVDQQRASAGARTRSRDRVFHNSMMGLGLWDGGRPGHRGTRQWVRWWRKRGCPGGVCRLVVPDRLHWGCCRRVILRVSARPLVAHKVFGSVPSDC